MLDFLKKWLSEPSTKSAIVTLFGALGVHFGDAVGAGIAGLGLALVILWDAWRKDQGKGRDT